MADQRDQLRNTNEIGNRDTRPTNKLKSRDELTLTPRQFSASQPHPFMNSPIEIISVNNASTYRIKP